MVHSETGMYSDWDYCVEGIFSTYDKAKTFIEAHTIPAYHHKGKEYGRYGHGFSRDVDAWQDTSEFRYDPIFVTTAETTVIETVDIVPSSKDGKTFNYVMPDGVVCKDSWIPTWYITEYEVDGTEDGN